MLIVNVSVVAEGERITVLSKDTILVWLPRVTLDLRVWPL